MPKHRTGRHLIRLLPAMVVAILAACGPLRRNPNAPQPASIIFANNSLSQADVFIVAQGMGARRIGTVMAGQTATLNVPTDVATRGGPVNVIARLLGSSRAPQTGPVSILPGERYEVRLPSDARLLSFLPARS
jgi:hypothetical protein